MLANHPLLEYWDVLVGSNGDLVRVASQPDISLSHLGVLGFFMSSIYLLSPLAVD